MCKFCSKMGDMRSITSIFLKILLLACCDNVSAGKEVFHSHAKRSLKGYTRFGYQNPIFVAPTLPPSLTYERESQDKMPNLSKEEPEESRPTMVFYETENKKEGLQYDAAFPVNGGRVSKFFYNCTTATGQIVWNTRPCLPAPRWSTRLDTTMTIPKWSRHRPNNYQPSEPRTHAKFGHLNPIAVAPTLAPYSPTPTHRNHQGKTISTTEMTTSTSPCEQDGLLDRKTNRCFALGSVEPCGGEQRNMAFYSSPNTSDPIYGECDCMQRSSRPLVYHKSSDTCYFVYQQAYCRETHWLVISDDDDQVVPTCQPNPCWDYGQLVWNWTRNSNMTFMNNEGIVPVFEVEKCVPLGQVCHRYSNGSLSFPEPPPQANNPHNNFLYKTVLTFLPGSLQPSCNDRRALMQSLPVSTNYCQPGSKRHILGRCNLTKKANRRILTQKIEQVDTNTIFNSNTGAFEQFRSSGITIALLISDIHYNSVLIGLIVFIYIS